MTCPSPHILYLWLPLQETEPCAPQAPRWSPGALLWDSPRPSPTKLLFLPAWLPLNLAVSPFTQTWEWTSAVSQLPPPQSWNAVVISTQNHLCQVAKKNVVST